MKKILFLGISTVAFFVQACESMQVGQAIAIVGCAKEYPDRCVTTFAVANNPYPLSIQGGSVTVETGRAIQSQEIITATLAQEISKGISKTMPIKKEQITLSVSGNSIVVTLFQPDLMDFSAGAATLALTLTPYEGAVPQTYTVNLQLN